MPLFHSTFAVCSLRVATILATIRPITHFQMCQQTMNHWLHLISQVYSQNWVDLLIRLIAGQGSRRQGQPWQSLMPNPRKRQAIWTRGNWCYRMHTGKLYEICGQFCRTRRMATLVKIIIINPTLLIQVLGWVQLIVIFIKYLCLFIFSIPCMKLKPMMSACMVAVMVITWDLNMYLTKRFHLKQGKMSCIPVIPTVSVSLSLHKLKNASDICHFPSFISCVSGGHPNQDRPLQFAQNGAREPDLPNHATLHHTHDETFPHTDVSK